MQSTNHENVSILVLDIVSFTELTHALGPTKTMEYFNEIITIIDHIKMRFPTVRKLERVGDGIVYESGVVYGSNILEENCSNMLDFALAMTISVSQLSNHPLTGQPLQFRIGIHCGSCVAGLVGNKNLVPHFTLFGDIMNMASRLETTSSPGMIHVSSEVFSAVDSLSLFNFSYRGIVDFKGLGKGSTYWLLGRHDNDDDLTGKTILKPYVESKSISPSVLSLFKGSSSSLFAIHFDNDSIFDYNFDVRLIPGDVDSLTEILVLILNQLLDLNKINVNPVTLKNFWLKLVMLTTMSHTTTSTTLFVWHR